MLSKIVGVLYQVNVNTRLPPAYFELLEIFIDTYQDKFLESDLVTFVSGLVCKITNTWDEKKQTTQKTDIQIVKSLKTLQYLIEIPKIMKVMHP